MITREGNEARALPTAELGHLASLERFVAGNGDLQKLEQILGRFNVFDALKVARRELQHSNFLAWLIDPHETHGQGDLFLKAVLVDILRKVPTGTSNRLSPARLDGTDLHDAEIKREYKHIDLLIEVASLSLVIAIENKLDSGEHSNQLNRYRDTIDADFSSKHRVHVFLTRDGDEASDANWISYSYEDLKGVLEVVCETNRGSIGTDVAVFIDHYLTLIRSQLMDDHEIDSLCKNIYRNHKAAIDLIVERAAGQSGPLLDALGELMKQSRYDILVRPATARDVRGCPRSWQAVLPPIAKDGEDKHAWLTVRFSVKQDRCWLTVRTSLVTDVAARNAVIESLMQHEDQLGLKPKFKSWREQLRVLLTVERIAAWSEEEEPDVDGIVDKARAALERLMKRLEPLPSLLQSS